MRRAATVLALAFSFCASVPLCLRASVVQCPDGTPPPCRGGTSAAARRPNPPLDDRTWIILPFENVARVADIDWLRDASVNLLYLDMSKWRDIRVIDDERVADLVREVPEARGGAQLTLQSGIAVARRAGAGKLVMGDLLKIGSRTRVVAKIYDVRSGQRVRNVVEETASPDSLMQVFGRLARAILAADPPAGASLGAIGTTSLDAYRAYVAGVTALNRVDIDSAAAAFNRAIGFDSTFALAHYKASVVYGWRISPGDRRRIAHAEAANRFSAGLPPRERQLILGQQQTTAGRWSEACQTYSALLRADSSDVEAWYNFGECNFHDPFVAPVNGDTARLAFRSSWNTAMRAFQRALELDPTYHLAYTHIPDILLVETRQGCRRDPPENCQSLDFVQSYTLRHGDTLVTTPISAGAPEALAAQAAEAVRTGVSRTNLQQNRTFAQAWVNSGPGERRAHLALGRALLRLGQPREAAREYELARGAQVSALDAARMAVDRIEMAFKLDSIPAVARLADSLDARPRTGTPDLAGLIAIALGRWGRLDLILGPNFQGPPQVKRYLMAVMQTMQGAPPGDLIAIELGVDTMIGAGPESQRRAARNTFLAATIPWTVDRERPEQLRQLDTASAEPHAQVIAWIVRGDTARARAALVRLDSIALAVPRDMPTAFALQWSAEAHLWLADTATALARLLEVESRMAFQNPQATYIAQFGNFTMNVQTWGRTFLHLGDLAAARGDRATAQRNYRRVVDLWSGADAAFQPMVQRARAWLARSGGS